LYFDSCNGKWLKVYHIFFILLYLEVSQPHFRDKCEGEAHTPKSGKLEFHETPENSELESRGQNTSHWGVLYTIGKVLKCKRPKWPRMSHLDICSPSYGQKEGPGVKLAV
jgi:hypothetical protein